MKEESSEPQIPEPALMSVGGTTTIGDNVIATIVAMVTKEVDGVHDIGTTAFSEQLSSLAQRITNIGTSWQGISVEVGQREAAIDLQLIINYGVRIPDLTETIRRRIIERIEGMTGLTVKEVNIGISALVFPQETPAPSATPRKRVM